MDKTNPSPRLQAASKEIVEILDKYDIGGYIVLASQSHGEYLLHFPKWSKVYTFEENGKKMLRFQSKIGVDDEAVSQTVHMIQVFQMQGAAIAGGMDKLLERLETKMFITGGPEKIE